ncbi:alkaline phosphatase family protein [Myxococcota bacterium]|nr:alkaline phosphatase family protein [Myxococcota bacterium]
MLSPHFIHPDYNGQNFYQIPQTICHLLTPTETLQPPPLDLGPLARTDNPYKKIVCLFVDALGWRFLQPRIDDYPMLREIAQHGHIAQLTAQFPSTTAAHMTTFHTALSSGQSGLFEWQIYDPDIDELICPLLFANARQRRRDTLNPQKLKPSQLYPKNRFYPTLHQHGVHTTAYVPSSYVHSTYSQSIILANDRLGYNTLSEGLFNLCERIKRTSSPAYFSFYCADIDTISHRYGPTSPQVHEEIDLTLTLIERLLFRKLQGSAHDTLFLLSADHGQVDTDPQRTFFLNTDPRFAPLLPMLRKTRKGDFIAPVGSARDLFLHILPQHLEQAFAFLQTAFDGIAQVLYTKDLIEHGFFGPPPLHPKLYERTGDIVILPFQGEAVWWYEKNIFDQPFYGHHGGLTPEEMLVPLLAYDFSPR